MNTIRNITTVIFQPTGIKLGGIAGKKFELMIQDGRLVGGPINVPVNKIKKGGIKLNGKGTATITLAA